MNADTRTFALGDISGEYRHQLTIPEMPTHNHTGTTDPSGYAANQISRGSDGTGNFVSESDGTHAHTFTTNNTGGSLYHNNMQPTIAMGNMFIYSGKTLAGYYPYTKNKNLW